jgi:hypothetical protein
MKKHAEVHPRTSMCFSEGDNQNMKRFIFIIVILAFMAAPTLADLTPIVGPPSDPTEPSLIVVTNSHEPIMEHLYGAGNFTRIDDDFDQLWMNLDGGATATAKYAGATEGFGYIDAADTYHELFSITQGLNGYNPTSTPPGPQYTPGSDILPIFRLALSTPFGGGLFWSSQESDNTLNQDHMVTFLITGGASAGNYVVAWEVENLSSLSCDADYQDLVVEISNAVPVPIPGAILLGMIGLGAAGIKLRKFA